MLSKKQRRLTRERLNVNNENLRYEHEYSEAEIDMLCDELISSIDDMDLPDEDSAWLRRVVMIRLGIIKKTANQFGMLKK